MGGISHCPVCGDLYYGDERDDWQTCRCAVSEPLPRALTLAERRQVIAESDAVFREIKRGIDEALVVLDGVEVADGSDVDFRYAKHLLRDLAKAVVS